MAATGLAAGLAVTMATTTTSSASSPTYTEPYRPQYHFSLPQGWIGDPNGLVHRDGRYYLYSYGTWQGAVSSDLVHWRDIPVTGPQKDPGSSAFYSGSAVVDRSNTSGFGTPGHPAMVAMYTSQMATATSSSRWPTAPTTATRGPGTPGTRSWICIPRTSATPRSSGTPRPIGG